MMPFLFEHRNTQAGSHLAPDLLSDPISGDGALPATWALSREMGQEEMVKSAATWPARGWLATGLGVVAGAYAGYVAVTWLRYGHASGGRPEERDDLLDRFVPAYEVVERHHIRVAAPAAVTLEAAREMELFELPAVRTLFRARALLLGAIPEDRPQPRGLLRQVQSLGWVVLDEIPGREIVVGAVTKPWESNVTFRSIPPDQFAAFDEPDYVKIAWTLRADPSGAASSTFRTETRVVATDASARSRFRIYWSCLSPGILLIRWMSLAPTKAEAERRAALQRSHR